MKKLFVVGLGAATVALGVAAEIFLRCHEEYLEKRDNEHKALMHDFCVFEGSLRCSIDEIESALVDRPDEGRTDAECRFIEILDEALRAAEGMKHYQMITSAELHAMSNETLMAYVNCMRGLSPIMRRYAKKVRAARERLLESRK